MSRHRTASILGLVTLALAALGCERAHSDDASPQKEAPVEASGAEETGAEAAGAEAEAESATPPADDPPLDSAAATVQADLPPEAPSPFASAVGRWESEGHCLTVLTNGDVELELWDRTGPKRLVMGSIDAVGDGWAEAEPFTLDVRVARIWQARYMGKCRKVHERGRFADDAYALGVPFAPNTNTTLSLAIDGDTLTVCGSEASCATLARSPAKLPRSWGYNYSRGWDSPPPDGAVVYLEPERGKLRFVAGEEMADVRRTCATSHVAGDRFVITCDPDEGGLPADAEWAEALAPAGLEIHVERIAGQRVRACVDSVCAELPRYFDSDSYQIP